MSEKKSSATQRVLKSVVAPALGTSLAFLVGCTTTTPPQDKPVPVTDTAKPVIPKPGEIAPSTQGSSVKPPVIPPPGLPMPMTAPTSEASSKPVIPDPGKIMPRPGIPAEVGKVAPEKVGKVAPPNPGKIAPPKVGTISNPGVKVGIHMDPLDEPHRSEPRPTRQNRRATDETGSLLRTGFIGGRKLT